MPPPKRNSIEDALREEIVEVPNGIVVPVAKAEKNAPAQQSGVLDAEGNFVEASSTLRPVGRFNHAPPMPDPADIAYLPGRYMYGGVMFGHFGHFLMDTLARIWAVERLRGKIDAIIFTPKVNGDRAEHLLRTQLPLMRGLGVDQQIIQLSEPTRVGMLYVPYQGIGIGDGWELATEAFRNHMRRHAGRDIPPKGPLRVYLSRSALGPGLASYLSEATLERHLEAAGYVVVHPQKLTKQEQIALYKAARYIISPDGSPLHLLAYVGHSDQKVAVISRRNALLPEFERQLSTFTGCTAVSMNCLRADWLPGNMIRPNRQSWGQLDMAALYKSLLAEGFLPSDTAPWPEVSEIEVEEEVKRVSEATGTTYRRYDPTSDPINNRG